MGPEVGLEVWPQ
jgi:hypothetical protein